MEQCLSDLGFILESDRLYTRNLDMLTRIWVYLNEDLNKVEALGLENLYCNLQIPYKGLDQIKLIINWYNDNLRN